MVKLTMSDTSWEKSSSWYNQIVGEKGQYYHQKIVIPGVLKMLEMQSNESLLDLGCGQGILGRSVNDGVEYYGVDASPALVDYAMRMDKTENHIYKVGDVTKKLPVSKYDFDKAAIILALQNMADSEAVFVNASNHLKEGGRLVMVINHPYFRIPKYSGWGTDKTNRVQFRWVYKYMSTLRNAIVTNPGKTDSETTWSFHKPLSKYSEELNKAGMVIEKIEEWISDKKSMGGAAKMENIAREEIPLFMAICAVKI